MSELTVGQIIKLILGLVVVVAVVGGIYLAFNNSILDFFKGLPGNESAQIILGLVR